MAVAAHESGDALQIGRSVRVREGVGATARIRQQRALRLPRVVVDRPALIVVRCGQKTLEWERGRCVLEAGDAVAVAGGQAFDITNRPPAGAWYEAAWLVWNPELFLDAAIDRALPRVDDVFPIQPMGEAFRLVVDRAIEAIANPEAVSAAVARHRCAEVLVWIAQFGRRFEPRRDNAASAQVRSLLSSAPGQPWPAPIVAKHLAMSEGTLRRRLAAEGESLSALTAEVRMSRALTLLQATDRPVAQIAREVGYESPSRFAARFRSRFGHAPTAIRDDPGA